jgi:hypothetical protein
MRQLTKAPAILPIVVYGPDVDIASPGTHLYVPYNLAISGKTWHPQVDEYGFIICSEKTSSDIKYCDPGANTYGDPICRSKKSEKKQE